MAGDLDDHHASNQRLPSTEGAASPLIKGSSMGRGQSMVELPPRTTLNGKWDAYCHVCWNAIYTLWVGNEPPDHSRCPHGAASAHTCLDAINRAGLTAFLEKARRDGILRDRPPQIDALHDKPEMNDAGEGT